MAIALGHRKNFETLRKAFADDNVCLLECTDAKTQQPVVTLCMVNRLAGSDYEMVPVAKFFDGNPYHELLPPVLTGDPVAP